MKLILTENGHVHNKQNDVFIVINVIIIKHGLRYLFVYVIKVVCSYLNADKLICSLGFFYQKLANVWFNSLNQF